MSTVRQPVFFTGVEIHFALDTGHCPSWSWLRIDRSRPENGHGNEREKFLRGRVELRGGIHVARTGSFGALDSTNWVFVLEKLPMRCAAVGMVAEAWLGWDRSLVPCHDPKKNSRLRR